jgi:hypothetical protein
MGKYFFDRVGHCRLEYDYKGRMLSTPEKAHQLAELIALDLGIEPEGNWRGWTIDVRNALGQRFFSVPVPAPELGAA